MNTIGKVIHEARIKKKLSFAKLEQETKIKTDFLEAIEKEDWKNLPDFPVILGFIKNIASPLELNEKRITALLRRDYPPKTLSFLPKPDIGKEFSWSPKLTFVMGMAITIVVILSYLAFQYISFVSPPRISVFEPKANQIIKGKTVKVVGVTTNYVSLSINNQPILVGEDGRFNAEIEVNPGNQELIVKAISRSRRETIVYRKIIVE